MNADRIAGLPMNETSAATIRGLLFAGFILAFGARFAVGSAMPARRGKHRRKRGSPRIRPQTARPDPVPVAGGATGLLESIPFLEAVPRRSRFGGTKRLAAAITLAASIIAVLLFALARAFAGWLETAKF